MGSHRLAGAHQFGQSDLVSIAMGNNDLSRKERVKRDGDGDKGRGAGPEQSKGDKGRNHKPLNSFEEDGTHEDDDIDYLIDNNAQQHLCRGDQDVGSHLQGGIYDGPEERDSRDSHTVRHKSRRAHEGDSPSADEQREEDEEDERDIVHPKILDGDRSDHGQPSTDEGVFSTSGETRHQEYPKKQKEPEPPSKTSYFGGIFRSREPQRQEPTPASAGYHHGRQHASGLHEHGQYEAELPLEGALC